MNAQDPVRDVLLTGVRIRALTHAAPYFGPRADPQVQASAWAELDACREHLDALVDALAEGRADHRPVILLEIQGCGELCFNGMRDLGLREVAALGADALLPEEEAVLAREMRVLRSRLAAVRGDPDPDHGAEQP